MEILSLNNQLVKETVKLQQKKYRTDKFLLEGYKAISEAYNANLDFDYVFVSCKKIEKYEFLKDKIIETNDSVLKKISTTESAPEAVAVAFKKIYNESILHNTQKVLLLENIKDLGNLGTIIRTAVAFNTDAIILYGNSTDFYNPKCIRSSVGNLWKIPIFEIDNFEKLQTIFKNFSRIATLPRSTNNLKTFVNKFPCLVMFGSEADGLSDELINFATDDIKIEMSKTVESLNLSISCGIVLYQIFNN